MTRFAYRAPTRERIGCVTGAMLLHRNAAKWHSIPARQPTARLSVKRHRTPEAGGLFPMYHKSELIASDSARRPDHTGVLHLAVPFRAAHGVGSPGARRVHRQHRAHRGTHLDSGRRARAGARDHLLGPAWQGQPAQAVRWSRSRARRLPTTPRPTSSIRTFLPTLIERATGWRCCGSSPPDAMLRWRAGAPRAERD